ncbi:MAG: glycosyltransferase family 4 protein [Chloracidobacterium sp.]|nr:glycosyltransferase family 4 protein [Chloracidobacterium sp.]
MGVEADRVAIAFLIAVIRSKPDLIHLNTALTNLSIWRDLMLLLVGRVARRPVILAIHGGKYLMSRPASASVDRAIGFMLRHSAAVIVLSEIERASLSRRWPNIELTVLPNAVDRRNAPLIERSNNVPVVVFLGRIHESKGIRQLAEACGKVHRSGTEFILRCCGDGPERKWFVDAMTDELQTAFEYRGVVAGTEKWATLASSDIFVLPSVYGEGMPMAMLEAMACRCVVIASDNASITAVIDNGENGFIVPSGDADALAKTLSKVIAAREDWPMIGDAARKTVADKFSSDDYFAALDSIYLRAVDDS